MRTNKKSRIPGRIPSHYKTVKLCYQKADTNSSAAYPVPN